MSGCRISKAKCKRTGRELTVLPSAKRGRSAAMKGVFEAFDAHNSEVVAMGIVLMDERNQVTNHFVLNKSDATPLIGGLRVLEQRLIKHEEGLYDDQCGD